MAKREGMAQMTYLHILRYRGAEYKGKGRGQFGVDTGLRMDDGKKGTKKKIRIVKAHLMYLSLVLQLLTSP